MAFKRPHINQIIPLRRIYKDEKYMAVVEDLINQPMVQDLKLNTHHKANNRFNHSLEVSYIAYQWAKRFGLNEIACARAGLLHDLFHYDTNDANIRVDHYWNHPKIAVMNAKQITDLTPLEERLILTHMWQPVGRLRHEDVRPSCKEGWLLTMVDKYCSTKDVSYYSTKKYAHLAAFFAAGILTR